MPKRMPGGRLAGGGENVAGVDGDWFRGGVTNGHLRGRLECGSREWSSRRE